MAASIVAAAIAAGVGIYSIAKANKQKKEAKRLKEQNKRPEYEIQAPEYENQRYLEYLAGQGISGQSKQLAVQNYDRNMSSQINAILKGGGDANAISGLGDGYNQGINQLALADDQRRLQNISNLVNQNRRMSGELDKDFQINRYAPYVDNAQFAAQMYAQADAQGKSGLNQVVGAVGQGAGAFSRMQANNNVNNIGNNNSNVDINRNYIDDGSNRTQFVKPGNFSIAPKSDLSSSSVGMIYDPSTNTMINQFNWGNIKPNNRQTMWNALSRTNGNSAAGSPPALTYENTLSY